MGNRLLLKSFISLKGLMNNRISISGLLLVVLPLIACSIQTAQIPTVTRKQNQPLIISIIPDSDPQKQQRQSQKLVAYLEAELGIPVEYQSIPNQAAAVTAFKLGDLELVWLDGLTGVQARLQVPGATAIAQRDIDEQFHSLFIAHKSSGLTPFNHISELEKLKGKTFIFCSESSLDGRLMPQYFLQKAGVTLEDFKAKPGFSENPDYTIQQVETGAYEVGAVNEKVWQEKVDTNAVNLEEVYVIWRTPAYSNYHWLLHPKVQHKYGENLVQKLQQAFLNLDPSLPEEKEILDLFNAGRFMITDNKNYTAIEEISREIDQIK